MCRKPPSLMCCKPLGHSTARARNSSACGIGPISSDRHISWGQLDSAPQKCLPGVHVSVLAISQTVAVHKVAVLQPLTLSVQKQKAAFRMNEHSSAY